VIAALQQHAANAAAKWGSLGQGYAQRWPASPGIEMIRLPHRDTWRVVTTRELRPSTRSFADFLADLGLTAARDVTVEDSFGTLKLDTDGHTTEYHFPVMHREPAALPPTARGSATVVRAHDEAALAEAERVVVDGFPVPGLQGRRGALLPPTVLDHPGWRVWLAYDEGVPAAGGVTFDDGTVLGVYFMATLPGHRSRGLARAVLTTALAADAHRPATLVATDDGRALYDSLGFAPVGMSDWYISRS
jgi:GNAT superfamily N-acetyltransferase